MIHEGFPGSTTSIPGVSGTAEYEDWLFSVTDNHWANLEVSKDFTMFCYEKFIKTWMKKKNVSEVCRAKLPVQAVAWILSLFAPHLRLSHGKKLKACGCSTVGPCTHQMRFAAGLPRPAPDSSSCIFHTGAPVTTRSMTSTITSP